MDTQPETAERGGVWRFTLGFIAVLLVFSGALSLWLLGEIRRTSPEFVEDARRMRQLGASADPEGCVDAMLEWHARCDAPVDLCELTVPRIMGACLEGQDRTAWCEALPVTTQDTRFGKKECEARGVTKKNKKACATAYRSIDHTCKLAQLKPAS